MEIVIDTDYIVNLNAKISPAILAKILGVNVSLLYQEKQQGKWGDPAVTFPEMTYLEAFKINRQYHVKNTEYKLAQLEQEKELKLKKLAQDKSIKKEKFGGEEASDKLQVLQIKQIEQKIKTDRVSEVRSWLNVAKEREELLIANELKILFEPFILLIKNKLVSIGLDFPEVKPKIDETLGDLAGLGTRMLEQVKEDKGNFVEEMMAKSVEDDLLELQFLPKERDF